MTKPIIGIGSDVLHKKGERERAFAYTTYIESLQRAGAVPVVIPPQPENAEAIVDGLDGVLLAGGDDCDRHDVLVEEGTRLAQIIGEQELNVNSSHHQAIRHVGEGLRVTALAPDGIIEGLEDPSHPFYVGVQWHPEDMAAESSATSLFGAFVDAARKYAEKKRNASTDLSPVGAAETE